MSIWHPTWKVVLNAYRGQVQVALSKEGYRDDGSTVWCNDEVEIVNAKRTLQEECDRRNKNEAWARDAVRRLR